MNVAAQCIGIFAMTANISSYQFESKRHVLLMQLIGSVLFAVNMFLLGAVMGGILNVIAIFRAFVYMLAERHQKSTTVLNRVFLVLYGISYILVFTVFSKAPTATNFATELLPLIGMAAMTVGFSKTGSRVIRICGLINSPCWLVYNCINFSIGGILCEVISLISIITAVLRLDKRTNEV